MPVGSRGGQPAGGAAGLVFPSKCHRGGVEPMSLAQAIPQHRSGSFFIPPPKELWHPGIQNRRKWRQRVEMGGKVSLKRATDGDFALNRVLKWTKRAKNSVFVPKITCFVKIWFVEHRLLEEIILNEVSLGGSPTISATLF